MTGALFARGSINKAQKVACYTALTVLEMIKTLLGD
jgi:hypothetical protein